MLWLRQSTASQEIQLGKFVDDTDGKTAETALSIANTDIKLWKEGATSQASKNSGGATHIANGWYYAVLDATDTNTLGKLEVTVDVSGALSVRREFMVLPANVYDALVLDTDVLETDLIEIGGDADSLTIFKLMCDCGLTAQVANDVSNSASSFCTTLTSPVDDYYNGLVLIMQKGEIGQFQGGRVTNYDGTTKFITIDPPLSVAPFTGADFLLIGRIVD